MAKLTSIPEEPYSEFNVAVDRDTILARIFRPRIPECHLRVEFQTCGQAAPHGSALHHRAKARSSSCARWSPAASPSPARRWSIAIITLNPGRSALADPNHRYPAEPLRPGSLRPGGCRHSGPRRRDRPQVRALQPGRGAPLFHGGRRRRANWGASAAARPATTRRPAPPVFPRASPSTSRATTSGAWGTASACARAPPRWISAPCSTTPGRGFASSDNLNISFTGLFEHSRDMRTFNFTREEGSAQLSQRLSKSVTLLYRYTTAWWPSAT